MIKFTLVIRLLMTKAKYSAEFSRRRKQITSSRVGVLGHAQNFFLKTRKYLHVSRIPGKVFSFLTKRDNNLYFPESGLFILRVHKIWHLLFRRNQHCLPSFKQASLVYKYVYSLNFTALICTFVDKTTREGGGKAGFK